MRTCTRTRDKVRHLVILEGRMVVLSPVRTGSATPRLWGVAGDWFDILPDFVIACFFTCPGRSLDRSTVSSLYLRGWDCRQIADFSSHEFGIVANWLLRRDNIAPNDLL